MTIDLVKGAQRSAEHLSRNPQGLVPALEIDGQIFTQSLAIIEYLDETRALGLLPGTAAERARLRALAQAIAIDIHPVC
ncbi:glutathione S-transferase N-terminal domain-containing protein, partial [Thioclava sp.]|uniref:glutathione S-transferase N-terminal domain-containing protein n=1 Tax=Thioclava sp. TaxID=1933450 RepID=UPI003AA815BF